MKKAFKLLPILLFCLGAGCTGSETALSTPTPSSGQVDNPFGVEPFVYLAAEEAPINVEKEGCEILYIEIINIPSSGIKIACWDDYGIKFKVTYNDFTTQEFPFLTKHFPMSSRHYLGEVGHHNLELIVNDSTTRIAFDVIRNPDFKGYDCVFIDSRTSQTIYKTVVGYFQNVEFGGTIPADEEKANDIINRFIGWDYPLECVHQNMVYTTYYRDIEKRYYGNAIASTENPIVATVSKDDSKFVLGYLGRVHAVPINYGDSTYHIKGQSSGYLHLHDINPYSEIWNETNESIFKNTLNYSFSASAAQYLYGNNNSFNSSPTFLSNFESMYEIHPFLKLLDNGLMVYTSTNAAFKTCYDYAEATRNESKYINSYDDTGYYRLAATVSFDIFVSLEFKKLNNNKYSLNGSSEFFFAPVNNTLFIRKQFSDNNVFDNYFGKKINYSNETFLNIARSLDWGNE